MKTNDDDNVETLLRRVERRQNPSARFTEEVYQHIREIWLAQVRRRRWINLGYGVAAAAAVVGVFIGMPWSAMPAMPVADLVSDRAAQIVRESGMLAHAHDAHVYRGDTLVSRSSPSAVRMKNGIDLTLDAHSRVRLASLTELKLLEGRLFIDTHGRAATSSLRVVTEMGRVEHIGTQFQVSTDDAGMSVAVLTGEVAVHLVTDEPVTLRGGQAAIVDSNGHVSRRDLRAFDATWNWKDALEPPLKIDGLSLHAVLEFVAIRSGLHLKYTDPATKMDAQHLTLHGAPVNLPSQRALDAVLATTTFSSSLDGLVITIAEQ